MHAKTENLLFIDMRTNLMITGVAAALLTLAAIPSSAQKYSGGLIDKSIAVVGNEMIMISQLEEEVV